LRFQDLTYLACDLIHASADARDRMASMPSETVQHAATAAQEFVAANNDSTRPMLTLHRR